MKKFSLNYNQKKLIKKNILDHKLRIPKMVWMVGLMMFFANFSSIIIFIYCPIYLKEELGYSLSIIGFLEGLAEGTSFIMKLLSGILSDILQKRKLLIGIGYGIVVLAKYVFAIFSGYGFAIIFARMMERVGNGIQAAPRSALVGDIAPSRRIGACYGLKRSLATIGSVLGAFMAGIVMWLSRENYRTLFWFTAIPVSIGFLVFLFFIKEPLKIRKAALLAVIPSHTPKYKQSFSFSNFKLLGITFWKLMIVNFIFLLSRMGEAFLSIHARDVFHLEKKLIPTVMIVFNLAWAMSSYPVGLIADKMNRYWLLCLGIISLVLSDITLATSNTFKFFYVGVALWGIQYGTTMNIFLSLISEVVPENLRGTGLGIYFITCAIGMMIGDSVMGRISHRLGTRTAFVASGIIASFALIALIIIMGYKIKQSKTKRDNV
ncbi:MAG: MFS transporter [Holosporales bacterium]|nr:MFS transporter [Holosporales bacterium]